MESGVDGTPTQGGQARENERLREYVQDRLAGTIRHADTTTALGLRTPQWIGRNKPRRQDRRWATAWSPEQIANRLPIDFPDDESMRISYEAIYRRSTFRAGERCGANDVRGELSSGSQGGAPGSLN
jgi:hypothetical protein